MSGKQVLMIPDDERTECLNCHQRFSKLTRRHHCRHCGEIFCSDCTPRRKLKTESNPLRLCDACFLKVPQTEQLSNTEQGAKAIAGVFGGAASVADVAREGLDSLTLDPEERSKNKWKPPPQHAAAGLASGGKRFASGIWNGVTGIVVDPIKGAKKDGAMGFVKGIGTGVVGIVTRPIGGVLGLVGDTLKGIGNTGQYLVDAYKGDQKQAADLKQNIKSESVFGVTLDEVIVLEKKRGLSHVISGCELTVPVIVVSLITSIGELGGAATPGIFRISVDTEDLNALRKQFDTGDYKIPSSSENPASPNLPAALLKCWFRLLEEPLIPDGLYEECVAIGNTAKEGKLNGDQDCPEVWAVFDKMSPSTQHILVLLASLVNEIAANKTVTKMDIPNLAICLTPSLLRCPDLSRLMANAPGEIMFSTLLFDQLTSRLALGPPESSQPESTEDWVPASSIQPPEGVAPPRRPPGRPSITSKEEATQTSRPPPERSTSSEQ